MRSMFAGVGPALVRYAIDLEGGVFEETARIECPGRVQGGAFSQDGRFLYVLYGAANEPTHGLRAVGLSRPEAPLAFAGPPLNLPARAITAAVHPEGDWLLVCFVDPALLAVHPLGPSGEIGDAVVQERELDFGIVGHDVVCTGGKPALVVTAARGHDAAAGRSEVPGSLRQFHLERGQLLPLPVVAPGGGYGFGPRNLAFHPSGNFVYVSLERQNALQAFPVCGGLIRCECIDAGTTLQWPDQIKPRQYTGCVHVHPRGHAVYVVNRAEGTVESDGERLFNGGENTIAVYALDAAGGNPRLVQHTDTACIHPRSFHVDQGGRHLVVAGLKARKVRDARGLRVIEAGFSVLGIEEDGRLRLLRKHAIETGREMIFWMDMPAHIPAAAASRPKENWSAHAA